jgi:hypothetical protein
MRDVLKAGIAATEKVGPKAGTAAPIQVNSDEDYAKVPPGGVYMVNGVTKRKAK